MIKRIKSSTILMIIIVAILTGCASSSSESGLHDPQKIQKIRVNKSNKQQVKSIIGEPHSITTHSDETESWVYESTQSTYTEKYVAKAALSFVPIPYLGTAVGLADRVIDTGPDKVGETKTLTLTFNKRGLLKERKIETKKI